MKTSFFCLVLLALLIEGGCKSNHEPQPSAELADTDVLMHAQGYWEWERSASFRSTITPASLGFSRQLIFKKNGFVHIYHNRQPALQPAYQLSNGVLTYCAPQPQPIAVTLVRYTAEPQVPNNDLRSYLIRLSPTDTTLNLVGEAACVDGGAYESYRWHRH